MKRILFILILAILDQCLYAQPKSIEFYIGKASQNSPLLKDYQNQVELGKIDSLRTKAELGIHASAISNNLFAPVIKGWGYDDAITDGVNLNAMISVTKEITTSRIRQNKFDAISLQNQSIRNTSIISEQELKKNISALYITAFGSWQQFNFNNEMLKFMTKQKEILEQLTETGSGKQTEFLSFLVNIQQQELAMERAKNQYLNDFALLNYTCGIQDTSFTELTDPNLKIANRFDFMSSVFYRQFEIDSLQLVNSDKQIDFLYQPKINIMADGGYLSTLSVNPYKNVGISVGFSVNIPLYDGGQRKMQHDQVAVNQLSRMDYRDFFANQFRQQNNQLWQQLQAKQKLEEKINKQIEYSKSLVDAYQKLLETGDIQIADYLLALANYLSAKNMLIENNIGRYQVINELNYLNSKK